MNKQLYLTLTKINTFCQMYISLIFSSSYINYWDLLVKCYQRNIRNIVCVCVCGCITYLVLVQAFPQNTFTTSHYTTRINIKGKYTHVLYSKHTHTHTPPLMMYSLKKGTLNQKGSISKYGVSPGNIWENPDASVQKFPNPPATSTPWGWKPNR